MPLAAGTRLGPYEVVSLIGVGGMGEVYRARDARLNRDVAVKVLPDLFASDPDRLSRFKREAQILASLSHPHIAGIYGFEESSVVGAGFPGPREAAGSRLVHALVLELVPGSTLAERIAQGPIPLEDALPIARQIAEALETAHEHGIVHRDLKPANIKVSDEGQVKVLDFGLAKALEGDASSVDVSHSPTLTMGATRQGVILGTAAYMAPEQARGKAVDRRADIWAFGCVLYEMLTGRRAFEGEVVSDTLAAILRGEPDWTALPASTPGSIRRLLRRCLEKDRRERLQAIGDARIEVKDALSGAADTAATSVAAARSAADRLARPVAAAILGALVAGGAVWALKPSAPAAAPQVTRSLLTIQPFDRRPPATAGQTLPFLSRPDRTAIALAPDGRTLVFRAVDADGPRLFVRRLDQLDATPLAGTTGADSPFFSPDGAWVGFWAAGELRKIPLAGDVASAVTRVPGPGNAPRIFGVSWAIPDVIVFATEAGLWKVPAEGGQPQPISKPSENEYRHTLPHVLPGGRQVLFTVTHTPFQWADARIVVRSLDTGEQKVLIENAADARYVPTGHIVLVRQGVLMAAPFDVTKLEVTAGPLALVEDVMQAINMAGTGAESGASQVALSKSGLVYATGGLAPDPQTALLWVDRGGTSERLKLPNDGYVTPRIAPDGRRVAVTIRGRGSDYRVWIHELSSGRLTALQSERERGFWNIWSRDGERLVFAAASLQMLSKPANGTGAAESLHTTPRYLAPSSWSNDGRTLAFVESTMRPAMTSSCST